MNLKIDQDFKALVPLQSPDEHKSLEDSILKNGFDEAYPIITWKDIIIDGHNRYEICTAHNIPFTTTEKSFDNRHEVINWMIENQLSRRNITADQRAYLIGKRYKEEKKERSETLKQNVITPMETKVPTGSTAKNIGNQYKVSHTAVKNAEKFADAVDKVADNTGIEAQKILSGEIKATRKDIQTISQFNPSKQKEAINEVKTKKAKNLKQAIQNINKTEAEELKKVEDIQPIQNNIEAQYGNWYKLGNHLLYCGSNMDRKFIDELSKYSIVFAFADPPYNAGTGENWDESFIWTQDWLIDIAPIVAVTPGIVSIQTFMKNTNMPYKWSVACVIDNGMARGALGFGNWIYVALFSKNNLHRNSQDILKTTIRNGDTHETDHKGRKPSELISWLYDRFSKVNDHVLDSFLGSGTSLLVAEKTGRKCIGAEISPDSCTKIIQRWISLTGGEAISL